MMQSDKPYNQPTPRPTDNRPWHVVICSKTLGIVYAGRDESQAKLAAATECMAHAVADTLGEAQKRAAINAGKIREIDRKKRSER